MTIYKLSMVVPGRRDLGCVQNLDKEPQPGDAVILDQEAYKIIDLVELMPPREHFVYLHATCQLLEKPVDQRLLTLIEQPASPAVIRLAVTYHPNGRELCFMPGEQKRSGKRIRPQPRGRLTRMHPDVLAGACPQCSRATLLRQVDDLPVPLEAEADQVDYRLHFCLYCRWNEGELKVHSNRELSQAELALIQDALTRRVEVERKKYEEFQQNLAVLPMGFAYTAIGAALGFEKAELSMVEQVRRGISPDVAYGEIRPR